MRWVPGNSVMTRICEGLLAATKRSLKLSAMADIGRIDPGDIPPAKDSVIDMLRVACYVHQIDKGIALARTLY